MPRDQKFKIQAPFPPKGDQPRAIAKLVEGAREGLAHQVLLGATGTGKSVAYDEPVTIFQGATTIRGAIGELLDPIFGEAQEFETLECAAPTDWKVLAYDAKTGSVVPRRITALSRHDAPEKMHRLQTLCGRTVSVTGDHSVFVLRDGEVQLRRGDEVKAGDALPVPLQLPAPKQPLQSLPVLDFITRETGIQFDAVTLEDTPFWKEQLAPFYPNPTRKLWSLRYGGEGISRRAAQAILPQISTPTMPSVRVRKHDLPLHLPLSSEFGFLMGQYLAEGCASKRFILLSTREISLQEETERVLKSLRAPYFRRRDGDFVISSALWCDFLVSLMGQGAASKRMPALWPSLDDEVLGALLGGYFDGDGGLDCGAVTAVTLSRELAYDVCEALLRFGIWARVRSVSKRKPDGSIGIYFKLTISGRENLRAFEQKIGFVHIHKKSALRALLQDESIGNTNVDLVFGVGARLLAAREAKGLSQSEVAQRAGCVRSTISAIETGKRSPSRTLFSRLCEALQIEDVSFTGLSQVHWSPIEKIEIENPSHPYVYDFSVDGYETFLTGRGGLFVHNTYTMANVIQTLQRPALVVAHNKTLAAQLCQELREFFPDNAVEYFVSYYDYYQPEAYVVHSDTFIEKESSRNDEIDRLRHSSTQSLTSRRDVIVVSSVSCIYGLGTPELYQKFALDLRVGDTIDRRGVLERLIAMQFARNDINLVRGTFRVRGDVLEIHPRDSDNIVRIDTFGDEIESIQEVNGLTGEVLKNHKFHTIYPATHFIASEDRMEGALVQIEADMNAQCSYFESVGKLLEAQRLRQRVRYDMEMMREVGYCNGIENYSRYLDGRTPGEAPFTLIDYFPNDYLLMIDESHQTLPQVRAMYNGDRARKEVLVDYGFRLPAAFDNRPLKFEEFEERMGQALYVSATPGPYELDHIGLQKRDETQKGSALSSFVVPDQGFASFPGLAEQIIRPTGLLDPEITIRPTRGQIDDLLGEIRSRVAKKQRVLCTTLTKRMAEDLTDYLKEIDVKVNYLHSDVETMERSQILRELRQGKYDVLVGINLLREGLDLPEVSLVAILDADKEGFLRSETSLIQTIGRAARHVEGQVIMYADRMTGSMERAIDETNRRRAAQIEFNTENGITPEGIQKAIREDLITELLADVKAEMQPGKIGKKPKMEDLPKMLEELESEMKAAASALDFERAAQLRDELLTLRELAKG